MKKILCALLALVMVSACFAACGGGDENDASSTQGSSSALDNYFGDESGSVGEDNKYREMVTVEDMGGREFNILERWFGFGKATIDFSGEVIWDDEDEGELSLVDSAKKKVLDEVQYAYNCTITGEMSTDTAGDIRTALREDIIAETGDYDFCFETYYYYAEFIQDGLLVDLNDLGMDLSAPWWDQNAIDGLSVCGELYYALGDINTYDNDGTFVCLFNKKLYEEKFGKDPQELYDLAAAGDWTFEELEKLVTGFGTDSKSDGTRDEFDTYGLLTETENLYHHMLASGNTTVSKDSNDEPYYSLPNNELAYAALGDAVALYENTNDVLVGNLDQYATKYEGLDVYENTVINAFKEGRGLFYLTSLIHLSYFSDMSDEFGILPFPKYSDAQDRYYHNMGAHTTSVVFVPVGPNSDGENGQQIGTILDALGAYSKDYLTPAYYEKQLKRGLTTDSESANMLDIVFDSRVYDMGAIFGTNWNVIDVCTVLDPNIASRVDSGKDMINAKIEQTVAKIKASQAA